MRLDPRLDREEGRHHVVVFRQYERPLRRRSTCPGEEVGSNGRVHHLLGRRFAFLLGRVVCSVGESKRFDVAAPKSAAAPATHRGAYARIRPSARNRHGLHVKDVGIVHLGSPVHERGHRLGTGIASRRAVGGGRLFRWRIVLASHCFSINGPRTGRPYHTLLWSLLEQGVPRQARPALPPRRRPA